MNLFQLMSGQSVKLAPKRKVLQQEEFSLLLDSAQFLEKLKLDAEAFRVKMAAEASQSTLQAEAEGFARGNAQWAEQLALLESRLATAKSEMEALLIPAVISAAKKIVGKELESDPDTIVAIVRQALKSVSQDRHFVIYANKDDILALEKNKPQLKELLDFAEVISLRESDEVLPGDCIIETEKGIIKVEAEKQWQALEAALRAGH